MGNAVEEVFNKLVSTVQPLSTEYYAKHLHLLAHLIFITNSEVKSISSLQIKTLKLREGKCLSPGHTASEVQTRGLALGLSRACALSHMPHCTVSFLYLPRGCTGHPDYG